MGANGDTKDGSGDAGYRNGYSQYGYGNGYRPYGRYGYRNGGKGKKTSNLSRQMVTPKTAVEMLVIGLVTVSMGTEMVIVRTDSMDIEMGEKEKKTSNLSRQMVTPKTAVEMLVIGMVTVSMGMEM